MVLRLFNSLGRRKEAFRPIEKKRVRMYTCGPTVWNYAHLGNFRTFLFEDVLRRYLKYKGYEVKQVMNITDVEDKIIKGMKQFGMTREALVSFYERAFMEDMASLNAERAEHYPRATEHIEEMVSLIKKLIEKGYAYRAEDGSTYFDISKFRDYGKLSGIRPHELKAGARVSHDHYEKQAASDFALWKAWDEEDGDVFWETELGKGRPGWHIECSAMSMKYLGETFDIHTGGMDNKFPHHENEIAQSEAATGKKFVRYWLHSALVHVGGEEMHKSLGNIVTLRQLLTRGWDPLTVRLFLISAHYRDPLDLTDDALQQAESARSRLQSFVLRTRNVAASGSRGGSRTAVDSMLKLFERAMDDDLNTPKALAAVFSFVKRVNSLIDSGRLGAKEAEKVIAAMEKVNTVLGVIRFEEEKLPPEIEALILKRDEARRRKDFETADRIRKELAEMGFELQDTESGTVWRRVRHQVN